MKLQVFLLFFSKNLSTASYLKKTKKLEIYLITEMYLIKSSHLRYHRYVVGV